MMKFIINAAVGLVLALALVFGLRGLAGVIFAVDTPSQQQAAAEAPAEEAAKEEKKAEAPAAKEEKKAEAPAAEEKPAEEAKSAEAPAAEEAKPAEESKAAEAPAAEEKPAGEAKTADAAPAAASGGGDAAAGEKVFKKCKACHFADKKKNKVGPYLLGVVGRVAASVEGFKYSDAMKARGAEGLVWTEDNIAAYLKAPKKFIPKNRMAFAGLKKDEDIANVIAYIKSHK